MEWTAEKAIRFCVRSLAARGYSIYSRHESGSVYMGEYAGGKYFGRFRISDHYAPYGGDTRLIEIIVDSGRWESKLLSKKELRELIKDQLTSEEE